MNDYFLRILIQQRHREILAAVRGTQRLQPERTHVTSGNESLRRFHSFYSKCKNPMDFEPPEAVERKIL